MWMLGSKTLRGNQNFMYRQLHSTLNANGSWTFSVPFYSPRRSPSQCTYPALSLFFTEAVWGLHRGLGSGCHSSVGIWGILRGRGTT